MARTGRLCSGGREPVLEEDGALSFGHAPLTWWHPPIFGGLLQDLERKLHCAVVW